MLKMSHLKLGLLLCAGAGLIACAPEAETKAAEMESANADHATSIAAAVGNVSRPIDDLADDENRKPGAVLAFSGVKPGMNIFEMESGSGYYTELLSYVAGPEGAVVMQNPQSFDNFLGDALAVRLADDRLANVRISRTNFDALDAEDGSADLVTWFLGPHDLYYTPAGSDGLGDVDTAYAEAMRILKPGGAFVVLDHAAAAGAPATTGGSLHRIDPAIVKGLAEAAGFVLIGESGILSNPDDMYDMGVFDPKVRRKTDRFLLKYVKPE